MDKKDKDAFEDFFSVTLKRPISEEDKKVFTEQKPGDVVVLNKEQKKKVALDSKRVNKVLGIKNKDFTKEKLPAHIRKAYITINDKKRNDLISITFSGDWTGSDINLAGKHLILEYQAFVRNRAIRNR